MPSPRQPNWLPYAGFMLAVGGIIYQSGQLTGDVRRNTERITKLEAVQGAAGTDINAINVRTARIEAKLDAMREAGR